MGDPEQVTSRPAGVGEPGQVPGRRGPGRLPAPPCAAHLRVELSGRNSSACTDRTPRAATPRTARAAGGRLRLAGESEVGELKLGALRVGAEQLRLLGVQESERLRAGPVRLHAHGSAAEVPQAGSAPHSSPPLR